MDRTDPEAQGQDPRPGAPCSDPLTRVERGVAGNFVTLRTVCASCGRLLDEEDILFGLDLLRCPVDPREDRCLTSCPVEEGSPLAFERPCLPVRKVMESVGIIQPRETLVPR
jgi:hypothetical protein